MDVKAEAAPHVMFVLCVFSPGPAILEIVNSIKQNVSFPFKLKVLCILGICVTMVMYVVCFG